MDIKYPHNIGCSGSSRCCSTSNISRSMSLKKRSFCPISTQHHRLPASLDPHPGARALEGGVTGHTAVLLKRLGEK
jgi:hypothetical protein